MNENANITDEIKNLSGQTFSLCIQCGACDSSCPAFLDLNLKISPRLINKLLIDRSENKIVCCELVEACMECLMCRERCPRGIDMSKIINALRFYIAKKGKKAMDILNLPIEILNEAPQIAFLELVGPMPSLELFEIKRLPLRKLQRSDDIWDLETTFVKEIAQSL